MCVEGDGERDEESWGWIRGVRRGMERGMKKAGVGLGVCGGGWREG